MPPNGVKSGITLLKIKINAINDIFILNSLVFKIAKSNIKSDKVVITCASFGKGIYGNVIANILSNHFAQERKLFY